MRVALACPYDWAAPGGVQVHVRQLAERLRKRGHRVLVVAPASKDPADDGVVGAGRPLRVPFNGSRAPIAPVAARRVKRALDEFGPDVVHAHEPLAPSVGMHATRAASVPVVGTFHAYSDRGFVMAAAAPLLRPTWERLALRIAVSEAARDFVARRFDGPVRIIPNGVEVEKFAAAAPADLPEGRRILFVNRLEPRKGFAVMVQAFALVAATHPDALLVVAGDGPERSAIRKVPRSVRDRIDLLGNVPHDLLPPYHAACEVFCAPATGRESFGIVLVEAMSAGLPIVATDIPGYREVVRDGEDGLLVPAKDPGSTARALRHLLDDGADAKRFSKAGVRRAARFSWDTVTREVEAAYEEAVGGA